MTCPICIPVDTVSPLGGHLRTNCRECGETMPAPEIQAVRVLEGLKQRIRGGQIQAVLDEAFAEGILEEPQEFDGETAARLDWVDGSRVLITSFAAE